MDFMSSSHDNSSAIAQVPGPAARGGSGSAPAPRGASVHLPHLRGRFLELGAGRDRLIDSAAAQRLAALTPEPRTVLEVAGDHMGVGPEQWKLLRRVVDVSRAWLVEQGAIEPPRPAPAASPAE